MLKGTQNMEKQIINSLPEIKAILEKDFDVLIKKNKDGTLKIMYYKPKNLKRKVENDN
jgi:hypothetical protein